MTTLGTLSIHLDGAPCRVGCAWCYLAARVELAPSPAARPDHVHLPIVAAALGRLDYDEVAVAVSEPLDRALPRLRAIVAAARAPVAVTTTPQLARRAPRALLDGVARLNLSIDSHKGVVEPARVQELTAGLKVAHPALEIVLIATLDSPAFAARLVDEGLLAALVALPSVDKVALNALKPPPPWCDRRFWMAALGRLEPLLAVELEKRLFLDCYVAARLVGLGGCPGRADLSPAAGGVAFRACVYQPAPDLVGDVDALAAAARDYRPPPCCPFEIR
ncbi:MAG TPA: hypothetical protein VGL86_33405 [Polyangia bacterium]|jgi:hypothetical protein